MPEVWLTIGVWVLIGIGLTFARKASWHSAEAVYWRNMALKVRLDNTLDDHYRPILFWCQANPPPLWTKVWKGWQSPSDRWNCACEEPNE